MQWITEQRRKRYEAKSGSVPLMTGGAREFRDRSRYTLGPFHAQIFLRAPRIFQKTRLRPCGREAKASMLQPHPEGEPAVYLNGHKPLRNPRRGGPAVLARAEEVRRALAALAARSARPLDPEARFGRASPCDTKRSRRAAQGAGGKAFDCGA